MPWQGLFRVYITDLRAPDDVHGIVSLLGDVVFDFCNGPGGCTVG